MLIATPALEQTPTSTARVRVLSRDATHEGAGLDRYFDLRAMARRRVLILDYDGTLAPLPDGRVAPAPYDGARELLGRLRAQQATRVVFVSGRPAREMADLLALMPRPEIYGVHGWERLSTSGQLIRAILPAHARVTLDRLRGLRASLEEAGAWMEDKYAAISVWWRGCNTRQIQDIRALLAPFETPPGGQMRLDGAFLEPFDGGMELRPFGPNKGSVVRSVLREEPREAVIAYFGDDQSDEEAFRALKGRGLTVRVVPASASDDAGRRSSAAQLTLRAPDEVLAFLSRWGEAPHADPRL